MENNENTPQPNKVKNNLIAKVFTIIILAMLITPWIFIFSNFFTFNNQPYSISSNSYNSLEKKIKELENNHGFYLVTPVESVIFELYVNPSSFGPALYDHRIGIKMNKKFVKIWIKDKKYKPINKVWQYNKYFSSVKMPWKLSSSISYYTDDYGTEVVVFADDGVIFFRVQ